MWNEKFPSISSHQHNVSSSFIQPFAELATEHLRLNSSWRDLGSLLAPAKTIKGLHFIPSPFPVKQTDTRTLSCLVDFMGTSCAPVDSTVVFDSLIKLILTYNCELWSQISKYKLESLGSNKLSLQETYFDKPVEKLHLQFCRTILGVSNKTSNLATLGELGRYPLMLHCYVQMIKYWHHIKTTTPKDSLVYKFINYTEQSETQEHCRWLSTKLRCSNHSLLIEQDRYSKLEVAERLCKKCNKVEDEIHFLIECKLYDSVRKKFFSDNNIISIDGNTRDTFMYCLNNKDKNFILNVAKFTTACFELRKIFSNCNLI